MTDISIDWTLVLTNLVLLGAAYVLALRIAWYREVA